MNFNFDSNSHAYQLFISMAWHALVERVGLVQQMPPDKFWESIEKINWPARCHEPFEQLSREHAARLTLTEAAACCAAAGDMTSEIQELFEVSDIWEIIPSEDGMEDFLYHLVGQGRKFVEQLEETLSPALRIANEGTYVESLRYVLDAARNYYPLEAYVANFPGGVVPELRTSRPPQAVNTMVIVSGLPAIVVRHDKNSVHLVTPIDSRDVPIV